MASVVDYHSVNLQWLLNFKDELLNGNLSPGVELLVANEKYGNLKDKKIFSFEAGATICVESYDKKRKSYVGTIPYGSVLKGEFPASLVSPKPRTEWTTEDVAEYVVKRACASKQCIYLDIMNQRDVSKKEYKGAFVSQARRCRFFDLVGALENFCQLKQVDVSRQYVWLDVFCANQPKLTASKLEEAVRKQNEKILTEGLHIAIANFEQRVMFLDKWDEPAALARAWCVWEIFGVAKAKKQIEIALTQSEYDSYIHTLRTDYFSITGKISKLDAKKAACFSKSDLEMIQSAIERESFFAAVNDIILSQLRLWVENTAEMQLLKEERQDSPDMNEIGLLATYAGLTYKDQGQYEKAEVLLRKALVIDQKTLKADDPTIASSLNNLAMLLREMVIYYFLVSGVSISQV